MGPGDDEALWQLLGRAPRPEASPYFVRRVLREVALDEETRGHATRDGRAGVWLAGLRQALGGRRLAVWPSAVAVVAVFWLSVVLMTNRPAPVSVAKAAGPARQAAVPAVSPEASPAAPPTVDAAAADDAPEAAVAMSRAPAASEDVASQDVEVIADLDNLIAHEENRLWTDDTARF